MIPPQRRARSVPRIVRAARARSRVSDASGRLPPVASRLPGKIEQRLALAILLTAIIPLAAALFLANSLFSQASAIWFNPEVGQQLDRGVDVYKDYVKAIKDDMRHQTDAIAADEILREAAKKQNTEVIEAQLDSLFPHFPEL